MSLSLNAPKGKAKANSLTNGRTVLPEKDRATLESDPSVSGSPSRGKSHRERITAYLGTHGPASIRTIAHATGINANSVNVTLHNGKGRYFIHCTDKRTWGCANGKLP